MYTLKPTLWKKEEELSFSVDIEEKQRLHANFIFLERLKSVRNDLKLSLHSPMVSLKKKKSESLMKYYMKVTCAFKRARKLPRKTETYESAKCVPCNTRKCTHNGFVSDLLKWVLKCRFYRSQRHIPTMTKVSARAYVYRGWYSKRIQ